MPAVWTARHEDLVRDGGGAPHVLDHLVVPARGVVRARCNPPESAVDAGLAVAPHARRAACAAPGDVVISTKSEQVLGPRVSNQREE